MVEKVLEGGYAAVYSSYNWMASKEYLECLVIDLPIAYSEQLSHMKHKTKNNNIAVRRNKNNNIVVRGDMF